MPFCDEVGGDAHLAAVLIDLLLDDAFDLAEVGRQVDVERFGELGDLRFGGAHLQLGVVLRDLLAQLDQLLVGVLDLLQAVAVGRLVHAGAAPRWSASSPLAFCSSSANFAAVVAIAGLQVGLGLRLELLHVRLVRRHLPRHALDQAAVLLEPAAPFLELLDRPVVLVAHLRDRIGLPEQVGDLVDLRHERRPELVKNHRGSFDATSTTSYFLAGSRSPPTASARILPW